MVLVVDGGMVFGAEIVVGDDGGLIVVGWGVLDDGEIVAAGKGCWGGEYGAVTEMLSSFILIFCAAFSAASFSSRCFCNASVLSAASWVSMKR